MSFWNMLFGSGGTSLVKEIGDIIDDNVTSDEEREALKLKFEELRQKPLQNQHEVNLAEAQHRSAFVAGWRPAIGWVCAIALLFSFVINPCIQWYTGEPGFALPMESIMAIVTALLGLGGYRSIEKIRGISK